MAFRPRRQHRKNRLLNAGLLPFEAHALSSIPLNAPYMRALITNRKRLYKKALRQDWTKTEYNRTIMDLYRKNDWTITEGAITRRKSIGRPDPWAMFRSWRKALIDSGDYVPPPSKKKGKTGKRRLDEEEVARARQRRKGSKKNNSPEIGRVVKNPKTGLFEVEYY